MYKHSKPLVFLTEKTKKAIQKSIEEYEALPQEKKDEIQKRLLEAARRVRIMAAQRRRDLAIDPELYRAKITI